MPGTIEGPGVGEVAGLPAEFDASLSPVNPLEQGDITLNKVTDFDELVARLRRIEFRGVVADDGSPVRPYADAKFSLATVYPSNRREQPPTVLSGTSEHALWTPQPTIYENQTQVLARVHKFLSDHNIDLLKLTGSIDYSWKGRGDFTILPPVVEVQRLPLRGGTVDLAQYAQQFDGLFVPDKRGARHPLAARFLTDYYVDEVSTTGDHFDIFNNSLRLLNYGLNADSDWDYLIICDGSHRIDYAVEVIGSPIQVILVEPGVDRCLYPYYAMPMPFRPTTRLSSKAAEDVLYPNLERDKVHVLVDMLRKVLHYDWTKGQLKVSSLRSAQK